MKKRFSLAISLSVLLTIFSACIFLGPSIKGNGHVTTEYREVGDFDEVKVSTGMKVVLVQSDKNLITVEADENLHEVIKTELKRDELNIFSEERIKKAKKLLITVEFNRIEKLTSSSGAMVSTDDLIHLKDFSTKASSGSQQNLGVNAQNLQARASSGSHIKLNGKAEKVDLKASSGAHIKGSGLVTEDCFADVSSGAHIYIDVTNEFEGEASSGGHIYYSGSPSTVSINESSGGNIRKQ
jgi:hypothetical protein